MTDKHYWQQRWQDNKIGFHLSAPNGFLVDHLPTLKLAKKATIFVPFCGASIDMAYLMQQGYQVVGSEISELACATFFKEQQLEYQVQEADCFKHFQSEGITIYCGDHYNLSPEWFTHVTAIYDRAAFVAVEPTQRVTYIKKLNQLIPNFKSLLIVQEYHKVEKQGPPYSLNETQIIEHYKPAPVNKVAQSNDSPTCQNLRKRGFADALECCYVVG